MFPSLPHVTAPFGRLHAGLHISNRYRGSKPRQIHVAVVNEMIND